MFKQTGYGTEEFGLGYDGAKIGYQGFERAQRMRMNINAIALALFLPWILFITTSGVLAFEMHYRHPLLAYFIVAMALLVAVLVGAAAYRKKSIEIETGKREPSWYIFLFFSCLFAWIVGSLCGDANYYTSTSRFYDTSNLNTYPNVDVSITEGQTLMDAGSVLFAEGTRLDVHRSMAFRNQELYCVAPIVMTGPAINMTTYDFWAVGVDCCSGTSLDYHCGQFNNPRARAGLRLMDDTARPFFRLAVQQAEAAYSLQAKHPLFFTWMEDPVAATHAYHDDAYSMFLCGIFAFFLWQLTSVATATLCFSKIAVPM
jgi:hypothetical protein